VRYGFSAEDTAFRSEVRELIAAHFPASRPYRHIRADRDRWISALLERGWAAYRWPVEYGGPDWTAVQRYIWERETTLAGVPAQLGGMGMMMLAPVLMLYGSDAQKAQHLPGIMQDRVEWCQGYSEPGAGSDLAALSTRAERDGDDYVVTGEKIWTSWAHIADWMFCLVRTSRSEARRQDGISFLLIDMKSPGVSVAPIWTLDGLHTINRVHLDGVRVPAENRIGEEGGGWTYAKALLTHERTGLAFVSESLRLLRLLKSVTDEADTAFRSRVAASEIDLMALETSELRVLSSMAAGQAPGAQSSFLKLRGTEIIQNVTTLFLEAAALYGAPSLPGVADPLSNIEPLGPPWAQRETMRYFSGRAASIAGGSDEVQRNIIARHVLGLP
jgi:alkylation response protein AidB-like acyl-CoA dehydrogenase